MSRPQDPYVPTASEIHETVDPRAGVGGSTRPWSPTIEDVENTDRPIVVNPGRKEPRRGHVPAEIEGELTTKCDKHFAKIRVADHFDERKSVKPCDECFPNGFPFEYNLELLAPYVDMGLYDVPPSMVPSRSLTLGESDE